MTYNARFSGTAIPVIKSTSINRTIAWRNLDMVSNGKHGDTTTGAPLQLRAITTKRNSSFSKRELQLAPRDAAQTLSFCTSVDSLTRRISSMAEKNFELTAIAGHDGKLISAFSKTSRAEALSIIEETGDDPGISHAYRLSSNTLQHVAHNSVSWSFAYLPEKKNCSQSVIKCQTMENLLAQIKAGWKRGYRINSMVYGNGHWVAVATQSADPEEQSFFTATDAESLQEKTRQAWDEGRRIACITYGADKWLVVLNKTDSIPSQKWLTRKTFVDLRAKIRQEWLQGFQVTALARGPEVWLVVLSKTPAP